MNLKTLSIAGVALFALATVGCGNTVRVLTATKWVTLGGGAAPKSSPPADPPAATPAAPAAPAAPEAAPSGGDSSRVLYVTYWEGECSSGFGGRQCSKGDAHIKRCTVKADNSMTCVDEADANKVFKTDQ
jgi:hypothetical protein